MLHSQSSLPSEDQVPNMRASLAPPVVSPRALFQLTVFLCQEVNVASLPLTRQIKQRGFVKLWRFLKQPFHPALNSVVFPADSSQTTKVHQGWAPSGAGCSKAYCSVDAGASPSNVILPPSIYLENRNKWLFLVLSYITFLITDTNFAIAPLMATTALRSYFVRVTSWIIISNFAKRTRFCVFYILLRKLISYFCW